MADDFDHLHLKRNTAGSSNELSFDVLDAARNGVANDSGKNVRASRQLHGSYHGVMGTSTLSGQAEVEKKKRRRRRRNALIYAIGASCVAIVLAVVGWFVYQHYMTTKTFGQQFDSLVTRLIDQDEFLAELDELVADPLDLSKEERRDELRAHFGDRLGSMRSICDDARAAKAIATAEKETIAINQMEIAADSRLSMMETGSQIISLSKIINEEQSQLNKIWNDVLDADQQARAASELSNKADTEEAIKESYDATQQARESLASVCQELESTEQVHPELNLDDQIEYLNTRIKSLEYALSASSAILEGDREKAAQKNDAYNEYDKKAVKKAEKLPRSISDVVEKAHAENYEKLLASYDKARAKTIEADAVVREYISS